MLRGAAAVLVLALAGCGWGDDDGPPDENDVAVQAMSWDGGTLGIAYLSDREGWRGFVWITDVLELDGDPDKDKRVLIHELEHVRAMDEHGQFASPDDLPGTYDERWYLYDSDGKAPFTPMPEDEVAWLAEWRRLDVFVAGRDELETTWLAMTAAAACDFVNEAAGEEVFRFEGEAGRD
jgi:hypothetical protein